MAQASSQENAVEEGFVKLADSRIQYFSRGKGESIVLLPGGTLTVGYLDSLADALANAGYRVIGVNFRGSGKSTGTSAGVTLETNADDVAGVVTALQLGPVHIAGNNFGNRVARMFAACYPELTRSVILLAAGGQVQPKPAALSALRTVFNPESSEAEILAAMPCLVSNPSEAAQVWAMIKPSRDLAAASIQSAAVKATPLERWWAPPGDSKYLILQGADDQIAPPENGVQLQKDLGARATVVNVPGAGHLLPLEQPDATASQMITFIRQQSSTNLLIHVHGFLSANNAERVIALRKYIEQEALDIEVISPQLPNTPEAAVDLIESIIAAESSNRKSISLIGHSLGGYLCTHIATKHQIKAVLVNPVVRGYEIMCEFLGECYNPHTDETFRIGEDDIAYLIDIYLEHIPNHSLFMVMQQLGDEITDPRDALSYYAGCRLITEHGGCHDFSHFERHTRSVIEFLYLNADAD